MQMTLDLALNLTAAVRTKANEIGVPMVIRLIGTNDAAAREMLLKEGIEAYWSASTSRSTRPTRRWL